MKLKSVSEVADSLEPIFTEADARSTEKGYAPIVPSKQLAENTITQDRQHTKEVLMGRVKSQPVPEFPVEHLEGSEHEITNRLNENMQMGAQLGFKEALDQALQIIKDTFKSE